MIEENLLSIIMPCYNAAQFISESINSVLSQTYQNWELLICDDCSTDGSLGIIKSYCKKDKRVKLFQTESTSGSPVIPRNICIEHAKGRFIAFLDADDIWLPFKIENQIPLFEENNVAIVFSDYEKIDEKGEKQNRIVTAPEIVSYENELCGNKIGNLTAIYDVLKVGKVFQKQIGHEDYLMWLIILKNGFIAKNTCSVMALYRQSDKSLSGNKIQAFKWTWNIFRNELKLPFMISLIQFLKYAIYGMLKFLK